MSKRRDVLLAAKALVIGALPHANVRGFDKDGAKPKRGDPGGNVIGHPGQMEELEADLSPLRYNFRHVIPLEIAPPESAADPDVALDAMMGAIGAAVVADRTLGGLCERVEVEAPDVEDKAKDGAATLRWGDLNIVAEYSTPDPLN